MTSANTSQVSPAIEKMVVKAKHFMHRSIGQRSYHMKLAVLKQAAEARRALNKELP